jgi:hypothetical protein
MSGAISRSTALERKKINVSGRFEFIQVFGPTPAQFLSFSPPEYDSPHPEQISGGILARISSGEGPLFFSFSVITGVSLKNWMCDVADMSARQRKFDQRRSRKIPTLGPCTQLVHSLFGVELDFVA